MENSLLNLLSQRLADHNDEGLTDPDPVRWIEKHFRVPETPDKLLHLDEYQEACLREALSIDPNGNFCYSTIVWSDIKKSIKSTIAAAVALWRAFQVEWGQIMLVANDLKQADSRVHFYIRRAIELNPTLSAHCKIVNYKIKIDNRTIIESVPIDPTGEAGGNADMIVFSELWGAHSEAQQRMWTEATLSPTKYGRSFRWVETYAGHTGESVLLEQLYKTGVTQATRINLLDLTPPLESFRNGTVRQFTLWNTVPRLVWQTPEYYAQEAGVLLPNEFARIHRNQWVSSQDSFIPEEWWNLCRQDPPELQKNQSVILAMDAGVTSDLFALSMVSGRGDGQYDIRYHRVWKPPDGGKIDFSLPETELRRLLECYNVVEVCYDPYQLEDMAGRMKAELLAPFYDFKQGQERLVADKMLRDTIRDRRLHYAGDVSELTEHFLNANAKAEGEKIRIVKKSADRKIDLAVATSMALARAVYWSI